MNNNITVPKQKNKSSRDTVIAILAEKWPLNAKEIFNRLKKENGTNISYQATHKQLNQLIDEGVVVKDLKNYALNKDWIKNLKTLGSDLEGRYLKNISINALKDLQDHGAANVTVMGILEAAKFILDGLVRLENLEKKPNLFLWRNVYSIIGLDDSDYTGIAKYFSEQEWYAVASEVNFIDSMFADAMSKYGVKIKMGVKEVATTLNDTIVIGNYVVTIWYPPEFREYWRKESAESKSFAEFDLKKHIEATRDVKVPINFIVAKNSVLADQIREQYLPLFNKVKK